MAVDNSLGCKTPTPFSKTVFALILTNGHAELASPANLVNDLYRQSNFIRRPFPITTGDRMSRSLHCGNRKITAVLLDVTGVLYESGEGGGKVISGSPEAVDRFVTC